MTEFVQYALLGLGSGAAYALLGAGVLLIHRGAGVVNFAQAALALVGALIFYSLRDRQSVPVVIAFITAALITALVGVIFFMLVMRPLGVGSPFARTIATLGLLILLQGVSGLIWGTQAISVSPYLSQDIVSIGGAVIAADRLILFAIATLLLGTLWAFSRYSTTGLALRALSENPRAAATLGWSPIRLGTLTWGLGALLAAIAGILIAPLSGVGTEPTPLLIIPVLAAVLLAAFRSFPLLLVAAAAIGIGQSLATNYINVTGIAQSLPFIVIVVFLVIRTAGIASRSHIIERLPALGSGKIHPGGLAALIGLTLALLLVVSDQDFLAAMTTTFAWALIVLSVVVIMGYTGQLSLSQLALGGVAALLAARLVTDSGFPFLLALVVAIAAAVLVGLAFALPALRARGINLAIVTLGLATVTAEVIFKNTTFTGPFGSITVPSPTLFGFDIGPLSGMRRYAIFAFTAFILATLVVAAVRRGTAGGRLIAVRTNERAAQALGISVRGAKLYAFGLAAAIAGLGGIVLAFANPAVDVTGFAPMQSVYAVAYAILGGVGYVTGTVGGAQFAPGGFGAWLLDQIFPGANTLWLQVVSGLVVILLVLVGPDGMARDWARLARRLIKPRNGDTALRLAAATDSASVTVPPTRLTVKDLTVRFGGGVLAVDNVSFTVGPGEIVALIGPNGAGKSTTIDAITGFVHSTGAVDVDNDSLTGLPAYRRARIGLSRSFQSLELFESLPVIDNLLAGADRNRTGDYWRDLLRPRRPQLGPLAQLAVREFNLHAVLDVPVDQLPYGQRRLVAVARALAAEPSLLLLDEPAAGLGDVETREFERVVRVLAQAGLSILLVEHDMRFVMDVSDRVVVIDAGRFLAAGTPDEVRRDPAVIAAYIGGASVQAADRPKQIH